MVLARETDRDADREQQAEVGEDRLARRGEHRRCRAGRAGRAAAAGPRSAARRSAASARGRAAAAAKPSFMTHRAMRLDRSAFGVRAAARAPPPRNPARARCSRASRHSSSVERADLRLEAGMSAGHDRELLHAEPDQERHRVRIRGEPAADRDVPAARRAPRRAATRDQPQHGRMQRVELRARAPGARGPSRARTA